MKNQVKSTSRMPRPDDIRCRDLKGFILFSIPRIDGINPGVLKAIRKEVHKHCHVKTAELTDSGNVLVVPHARNLRKSSMSYRSFKGAIKKLIIHAMIYEINRSRTAPRSGGIPALPTPKPAYVNDKTRKVPVAVPAIS